MNSRDIFRIQLGAIRTHTHCEMLNIFELKQFKMRHTICCFICGGYFFVGSVGCRLTGGMFQVFGHDPSTSNSPSVLAKMRD